MILAVWYFVMLLNLPSFGGPVRVQVEATTPEGCRGLRRAVVGQLGGESNVRGEVTQCEERP